MRVLICLVVFVAGCASVAPRNPAPATDSGSGFSPEVERTFIKTVQDGAPPCEAGHEAALADGVVRIKPGETVCVRLELHGDAVIPVSTTATRTADTLVIRAWMEDGSATFLSLHNPLKSYLRYAAYMNVGGRPLEYTSSCPVLSERLAIEHWPYAIETLELRNFKAEKDTGEMECR